MRHGLTIEAENLLHEAQSFTSPVVPLTVAGCRPSGEQVALIEQTLTKLPEGVIRRWHNAGGRLELVAGDNATIHPKFFHNSQRALGWCSGDGRLLVVAIDSDRPERTVLHEVGHAIDRNNRFSAAQEWCELSGRPPRWYRWAHDYYAGDEAEFFAECFSMYFFSAEDRAKLTVAVERFIGQAVQQFVRDR